MKCVICRQGETRPGEATVTLEREDGRSVRYVNSGSGFQPITPRCFDSLTQAGDGSWDETRFDTGARFHAVTVWSTSVRAPAPPAQPSWGKVSEGRSPLRG